MKIYIICNFKQYSSSEESEGLENSFNKISKQDTKLN